MLACIRLLAITPLLFFVSNSVFSAELSTTTGKKFSGELVSIGEKKIEFKDADGKIETLPVNQVLHIDYRAAVKEVPKEKTSLVELIDGSKFRTTAFRIKGKTVEVELYGAAVKKPLSIPLSQVYHVFREPDSTKLYLDFLTLVRKRSKRDIMVVKKGDSIDGVEGTFGEADPAGETIDFEIAGGAKSPIRLTRVLGLIFNQPPDSDRAPTLCKLIDRANNAFSLKAIQLSGTKLKWTTVTGVDMADQELDDIARLDFSIGALRYLSDLDPASVIASSTNEFIERYRRDANLDGREITLKREKFSKGLTLPSRTELTFDVDGFREFRAVIGVDDELEADSKATLKIEADGKVVFTQVIQKKDANKPLIIGIQNTKSLRITVESALLDLGNQVSLGDARVIK